MDKPWYKHYDEGVPITIDYPSFPLDQYLTNAANKHPNHTAIVFGAPAGSLLMDAKMSYGKLNQTVDRFAVVLSKMGVKQGDRVAIMLPNCPQFIIAAFATWRLGAIVVCCNPIYVEREVEHLLNDSGSETIIVMSRLYERVKSVRPNSNLKRVIVTNVKEYFPGLLKLLFTMTKEKKEGHQVDIAGDADTFWFQDVLARGAGKPEPVKIDPEDVATLIYTSGYSGVPKGVQLLHRNLVSNSTTLNIWAKTREAEDIMLAVMPYFHLYGLQIGIITSVASAMTIVIIPDPRNMVHVLMSIDKHKATFYPCVPTMLVGFNNFPGREKYDLTSLRFAASAAAPLAPEVQRRFEEITGGKIIEAYGLTETGPTASADPVNNPRHHAVGVPLPDTDMKIVDVATGTKELPICDEGEIIIKGPQVMKGYWNNPEATVEALRIGPDGEPGWFYSKDIGFMDEDGYFHITDRKGDMIITGGYNVYPAEVEAGIFKHPKVQEAAVIGVPHERLGEAVKAFVVLKAGEEAAAEEIIDFCRECMAPYKKPRIVEFREDLPKSIVGKVLRNELKEEELAKAA